MLKKTSQFLLIFCFLLCHNLLASNWIQQNPSTNPSARFFAPMAYDPNSNGLLLFGGNDMGGSPTVLDDTWLWNGTTWVQQSPATIPPARFSSAMAYDPFNNGLILFGGNGNMFPGVFGDTWRWDGMTWEQLSPTVSPPARYGYSMAYDLNSNGLILFGGRGTSGTLNDTWRWDGMTWEQLYPTVSPPARDFASLTYDPGSGELLLFGGEINNVSFNDTWLWDGTTTTWIEQLPTTSPSIRFAASMASNPVSNQLVLFGGDGNGPLQDTWFWNAIPTITTITPDSGPTSGGTTVTINGTNLSGTTLVTFNGTSATGLINVNDTEIIVITPAGLAGVASVVVTTPGGLANGSFTYIPPPPAITTVIPNVGPISGGTTVTINGTNLSGTTLVTFNGISGTALTNVNDTQITVVTPAGLVGAVSVVVTTPEGTANGSYTYTELNLVINPNVTQVKNKFVTYTDLVNVIKWSASTFGDTPIFFRIYRDSLTNMIGQVSANDPLKFEDHNRHKNRTYTYFVVAVTDSGQVSAPTVIVQSGKAN